jgi:hypothetical protein
MEDCGKNAYDGKDLKCDFCGKKGHTASFCAGRATEPTPEQREPWADELINAKRVQVDRYEGMSVAQADASWTALGEHLNTGNPWRTSTAHVDSLRARLGFWAALGADRSVLSWLAYGLPARTIARPPRRQFKNHRSYYQHVEFATDEINQQVAAGMVAEVDPEFVQVSHPLQVEVNAVTGKRRLCVDMRHTNAFEAHMRFTLETIARCGSDTFLPRHMLYTIDLRKAYWSVPMAPEALPYNCFCHDGKFYVGRMLFFGHRNGPFYFTKVMRPVLGFARSLGLPVMGYLDDTIGGGPPEEVKQREAFMVDTYTKLGWRISPKSTRVCEFTKEFLGTIVDNHNRSYHVPEAKVKRALAGLEELILAADRGSALSREALQSMSGTLSSMNLAIPSLMPYVRMMEKARCRPRDAEAPAVHLSDDELRRLGEVPDLLRQSNGAPMRQPEVTLHAHTDGGAVGMGAILHLRSGDKEWNGVFTEDEMSMSSTARELITLRKFLQHEANGLRGEVLLVFMDSNCAVRNLERGGTTTGEVMNNECLLIADLCRQHCITIRPVWVPRETNTKADGASKRFAHGTLRPDILHQIQERNPGMEVFVPKFHDVGRALLRLARLHTRFMLVFPRWPTQAWWPTLMRAAGPRACLGSFEEVFETGTHKPPNWYFMAAQVLSENLSDE